MGAEQFRQDGEGKTVREAFYAAKEQALYEHGHGGYSGTLAEKPGFIEFDLPEGVTPEQAVRALEQAWRYLQEDTETHLDAPSWLPPYIIEAYEDKWAEAVAVRTGETSWVFVGWASS